jgi:hypothetical protein
MSVGYCSVAIWLSLARGPSADVDYTPLKGQSATQKVFSIFAALSTLMFAVSKG